MGSALILACPGRASRGGAQNFPWALLLPASRLTGALPPSTMSRVTCDGIAGGGVRDELSSMAADAGKLSLQFVNTSGAGILVAPFGGINRRLSANPIAAGVPVPGGPPLILDMSACTIAEGKIRVALNKGVPVPDHCIIDAEGQPTNDPKVFYGPPPGAILSIAGHKGYGL